MLLAATILTGCANQVPAEPAADRAGVQRLLVDLDTDPAAARSLPILTSTGQPVTWSELVSRAAAADVVLIGEIHGHPRGLPAAAALFADLVRERASAATRPVFALEFFERDQQAGLDDFLGGLIDEPAMLRATGKATPDAYPPGHRAMILLAKREGLGVVAANAPRRYVRLARTDGYDRLGGLTTEQRRLFDLPTQEASLQYREAFDRVMNSNAGVTDADLSDDAARAKRRATLDATFRSQWLWDWTMGSSVSRALETGRPVVLVVGVFHVEHQGGTVQAIRALVPGTRVVCVSFVEQSAPAEPGHLGNSGTSEAAEEFRVLVGATAGTHQPQ